MPRVAFTPNLRRHLAVPPLEVAGGTVGAVLDQVFAQNPRLKSYVLDDQGRLRQHVQLYINDRRIEDRLRLSDPIAAQEELFVFQALSGG